MYRDIAGFRAKTNEYLNEYSAHLPVSSKVEARLLDLLDEGEYTHLKLIDGNAFEIVKLENYCGRLVIYRGKEGTSPKKFPCPSRIEFVLTPEGVERIICAMEDDYCEDYMSNYKAVMDFSVNITEKLADIDTDLPIADNHYAKLSRDLGGGYTFLSICDGVNTEIVKVSANGGKLFIERALENTEAHTFPVGSVVEYTLTPTAVRDIICQMDCCP